MPGGGERGVSVWPGCGQGHVRLPWQPSLSLPITAGGAGAGAGVVVATADVCSVTLGGGGSVERAVIRPVTRNYRARYTKQQLLHA